MKNFILIGASGYIAERHFKAIKNTKNKQNIQFCKADISNSQEVVNLFATLKHSEHPLYGIINAAGVQAPIGKFSENKMSEWLDNQKELSSDFRKLLQERIDRANSRRETLTKEEQKKLSKLEDIAARMRRRENVQNRQLQHWLSADEYEQIAADWDSQKIFREDGYEVLQQETATRRSATRYKEMPNVLDLFSVKGHWRAGMSELQKYDDLAARLTPSLVG